MTRRLVSAVVLVVCAGIYGLAASERATFILTDGERKSGPVVFHTESHENLIDGYLNLGDDSGGPELTIPMSQVAVIAFAGGRPSQSELSQVPASEQFLVLRNGQTQTGSFVNMIGGDTLLWRDDAGQVQRYALADVNRVYLNPDAARTIFSYSGPVGTAGPGAMRRTVLVQANQAWIDTGMAVKMGDRIAFSTSGQIAFGHSQGQTAGPDGNDAVRRATYPVPAMPAGGLIGRVASGTPFPIGSNTQPIAMPNDGRLMLGVNDDQISDNSGYFTVAVAQP